MAKASGQKFIGLNRAPRVHIHYTEPQSDEKVELPFVVGVLADLAGNRPGHGWTDYDKKSIDKRSFAEVDMDNFDRFMSADKDEVGDDGEKHPRPTGGIRPGISINVANTLSGDPKEKLSVQLDFKTMEDFSPARVAKNVPVLAELLEAREKLANLRAYMDGKDEATQKLRDLLKDADKLEALREFLDATKAASKKAGEI